MGEGRVLAKEGQTTYWQYVNITGFPSCNCCIGCLFKATFILYGSGRIPRTPNSAATLVRDPKGASEQKGAQDVKIMLKQAMFIPADTWNLENAAAQKEKQQGYIFTIRKTYIRLALKNIFPHTYNSLPSLS
ncbi:uncharacterized protein MCYG_03540 [Microsporum canis CBS 113480]|uniref:Uncharacterized protein n=1 Tax=Arthroderma otae (strain ATCC MYA-4605 / CBS 113480) TaxID=554155 RepID=C5FLZ9_ARTOC|nr:uncharacterized protein MCYG_03540 [Microsporum canis CBS 113480]EEQ30721.1 predicted protein [Microsporum canis CBS 113480]